VTRDANRCWGEGVALDPYAVRGPYTRIAIGDDAHVCGLRAFGTPAIECRAAGFSWDPIGTPLSGYRDVRSGGPEFCGLADDGSLLCWPVGTESSMPVPPTGPFASFVMGRAHACALRADGSIACWGAGAPDTTAGTAPHFGQSSPPEGAHFSQLAAGEHFTCGVLAGGGVDCWGWGTANGGTGSTALEPPEGLP
jgi:hypothetical protein